MDELNAFQTKCERALVDALGGAVAKRSVEGVSERFVTGFLPGTDLKVFIYLDGAEVSGPKVEKIFESYDFDSLDDLEAAFVRTAVELSRKGSA